VTVSGASAEPVAVTIWLTTDTPPNLAYATSGLMTFTVDPSITGNVQSMSLFLLTNTNSPVTVTAYDSSGAVVGQQTVAALVDDQEVSISSSGNPIATVEVHGPVGYFAVDTLTFNSSIAYGRP
jgi:hypothetical protein